jgi:hypothetical protein
MQQEQQQRHQEHIDHSLAVAPAHEAEAAVVHQPAVHAAPAAASFEQLTNQPAVAAKAHAERQQAPTTDTSDTVVEQLAHGMVDKELDENDKQFLATNGYHARPIIRGDRQFVMRTFVPTVKGKAPIVSFRGTVPTKVNTVIADLDPSGIGMYQFTPNREMIAKQINDAASHGKVISAGHSLGGALAQIAAATFPDAVSRVVTFQAPGVERSMAQKLIDHNEQHPGEKIESSHHRVRGDFVPKAGEVLTPGQVHNHELKDRSFNPVAEHLVYPLAQEAHARGEDVPIHTDQKVVHSETLGTEQVNEDKSQILEHLRTGAGYVGFGAGKLVHGAGELVRGAGEAIGGFMNNLVQ